MTQEEKDKLVKEWIEFESIPLKERSREFRKKYELEGCRALNELNDACYNNPELAWEVILQIHQTEHNDCVTDILAAGPLEDLLAQHGMEFISRVEAESRKDTNFKYLLGGVWQNAMTDEVWARVQAACK